MAKDPSEAKLSTLPQARPPLAAERLRGAGLRPTRQRMELAGQLFPDPTAM